MFDTQTQNAESIYRDNEIFTNRLAGLCDAALLVYLILYLVGNQFGIIDLVSELHFQILLVSGSVQLLLLLYSLIRRFRGREIRYLLFFSIVSGFAVAYFLYPSTSSLIIAVPILLSTRYCSWKYTLFVSIMNAVFMDLALFMLFLCRNYLPEVEQYSIGAEFYIPDNLRDALQYWFIPKTLLFGICGLIGVTITKNSINLIDRQVSDAQRLASVNAQLSLAKDIQCQELPAARYLTPGGRYSLDCVMTPAKQVGGDFYDYFITEDQKLCFCVADVSDKGIPAAMFMMSSKKVMNYVFYTFRDLSAAAETANALIIHGNDACLFLTCFVGRLDLQTGHLQYVNCGHTAPLLKRADGSLEELKDRSSGAIGMFENMKIKAFETDLHTGDVLLLYTDGVTDAISKDGTFYGEDRLKAIISSPFDPGTLHSGLLTELQQFSEDTDQFDDITIMELTCR